MTVEKPTGDATGHCGVTLDGIHFMITPCDPPRAQTAYLVPGETSSRGAMVASPGVMFGVPCRFEISRAQFGQACYYTFKVDDQVIDAFAVDTQEKVSGNQSIRMTCGETFPKSNGVGTHNANAIAGFPVTFSVYLKASTNNFPAKLNIWELWYSNHSTNILLSQEWQRHTFTWRAPVKSIVRGNVTFAQPGTVWADDIQIEIGDEATDYMASPLDEDRVAPAPTNTPLIALEIGEEALPQGEGVLDCYTRLNYYMNETSAVLAGTLALPDAASLFGRVTLAGSTREHLMAGKFALDIPLQGLADGVHPITLQVFRGGEMIASATNTLIKRAFQPGATQIDHQRGCLVVDGEPYLAIAPFFGVDRGITTNVQAQALSNMLRLHKDMGYRCFLNGAVDDPPVPAQAQAFFDLCAEEGVKSSCGDRRSATTGSRCGPRSAIRSTAMAASPRPRSR